MTLDTASGFFSHIPMDWILIAAAAIFIALDALRSGSGRASALALSLPAALFLIAELPHAKILSGITAQFGTSALKSVLFGIVFAIAYVLVRKMSTSYATNSGEVLQAIIAGIAASAVLVVVWLQVSELQSVWHFGAQVQSIFGEQYRLWWVAGAYAALAYVRS